MTAPERVEEETRLFLDDHPDAEDALAEIVEIDADSAGWTFDDIPLDSGRFGELVSRNIAEKTEGTYQLADREAVETALTGESLPDHDEGNRTGFSVSTPALDIDTTALGGLTGALALVVAMRMLYFRSVFQDGHVVSPGNDPYHFRFWQEQMLATSDGITDVGVLTGVPSSRALTYSLNWWFAELLGGTPEAAATVAAWLPVLGTVALALVLYALVATLTEDRRIAIAAVAFLAVSPAHVFYTNLGFIDHLVHQYFWLTVLAFALVWLAADLLGRRTAGATGREAARAHLGSPTVWFVAGILAVAVVTSVNAWTGSPLTFIPVALYLGFRVVADHRADVPPLQANAPTLAGLGTGTLLALFVHTQFGWQEVIAVAAPALVTVGGVTVALLAALWYRLDFPAVGLVGAEGVGGGVLALLFWRLRPDAVARVQPRVDQLFGREGVAEAAPLFSLEGGIVLWPLFLVGIGFYLGFAVLVYATWLQSKRYEPAWLVVVCFAWSYMILAGIQGRFTGQLSIFLAVCAAPTLVYLLRWLDLADETSLFSPSTSVERSISLPTVRTGGYTVVIVAVVLLTNLIFVPGLVEDSVHGDDEYGAAVTISEHAENFDREYPDNEVVSQIATNRMYNYVVNGEAEGYSPALDEYQSFLRAENLESGYGEVNSRGYLVLTDLDSPTESTHAQLFDEFGAGSQPSPHFQLLYATPDLRAFAVVEGATIETTADPGQNLTASTDVSVDGHSFTYERTGVANESGTVRISVAYPGEYDLGDETVTVRERHVEAGDPVSTRNGGT